MKFECIFVSNSVISQNSSRTKWMKTVGEIKECSRGFHVEVSQLAQIETHTQAHAKQCKEKFRMEKNVH